MDELTSSIETYRQEARELLSKIEEAALDMEQNPDDKENIDRLFRYMHTIKGSGAMFGFDDIADFTHHIETVLDNVRKGMLPVSQELVDLVLASRDQIKSMLDASDGGPPPDQEIGVKIADKLEHIIPGEDEFFAGDDEKLLPPLALPRQKTFRIRFFPDMGIFSSGMEPILILNELRDMGECIVTAQTETIPPLDKITPENCYLFWDIILSTFHDADDIKDVFIFVEENSRISIQPIEESTPDEPLPRLGEILMDRGDVTSESINESLMRQKRIGELLIESGMVSQDKINSALNEQMALDKQRSKVMESSVRVPSDKLDMLINLVGELVITQAHLSQVTAGLCEFELADALAISERLNGTLKDSEISESEVPEVPSHPFEQVERMIEELATPVEKMERLTAELRDCALNMRMLPIGTIFGRFRRLVRDLSMELGKKISLVTEGAETEMDKTVIERLNDPLVHLIRNSIDHGIQTPDERLMNGKPPEGTIRLTAAHKGAKVLITIKDDGMGLDPQMIREKAAENDLIPKNAELSDEELFPLIFAPGFSTAKEVTSISGRGVGMNVVKREVDSLGGSVRITSKKGKGTSVILSLPLTLAIIDGLLVKVGENSYVVPLSAVEECVELTKKHTDASHGRNMIPVRGNLIPFIRLREVFAIPGERPPIEQIAIVQLENLRVGIVVDEIIGNLQTVIKSLGRTYRKAEGVSGATIMGDGSVSLILDIPELIRCASQEETKIITPLRSYREKG